MRCLRMAPFVLLVATLALALGVASEDSPAAGGSAFATRTCSATCPPCPGGRTSAVEADFDHPNPAVVPHAIVY